MARVKVPTIQLNHGGRIPAIGYGTWVGLNDLSILEMADCPKMMEVLSYAIDIGYRHIDTAHLYRVEPDVGKVVNKKISDGVVKREELFITTKVWHHFHRASDVEVSVRGSLRRMGLDYLDLVLMHWPMSISQDGKDEHIDYLETWRGFIEVRRKGLARAIGVSNFNLEQLKRLLANSDVVPAVNQVEINLNLGQTELVDFCHSNKIVVVAFSPFGTMVPSRATVGSPQPKLDNPVMVDLARKYKKTVSQIALRHLFQRNIVSIPKTVTKSRVLENASIFDFKLSPHDVATIAKFDVNYRTVVPIFWQNYDNYPFEKVDGEIPEIPVALKVWKNGANADID